MTGRRSRKDIIKYLVINKGVCNLYDTCNHCPVRRDKQVSLMCIVPDHCYEYILSVAKKELSQEEMFELLL